MKLAANLKFFMELGINFSSIAVLRIKWFLSVLFYLDVTELTPSPPSFCFATWPFPFYPRSPFAPFPSLSSDSSLLEDLEDFEWVSSSSSKGSPAVFPIGISPVAREDDPSSPFNCLILFYSFSLIFLSLFLLRPVKVIEIWSYFHF